MYLKNQRRSPVETRFSNSYYVYSQPATPDEVPGKRKKARLSGRFPGTSVKKQNFRQNHQDHQSQHPHQFEPAPE
jgi:hypothetical protein